MSSTSGGSRVDEIEADTLVPARMINEFVYCPRLAYIEWIEGDFADNVFTVDGRNKHRRVDAGSGRLAPANGGQGEQGQGAQRDEDDEEKAGAIHARSCLLSAPRAGIIARIDLVEARGEVATPVDYKRGKPKAEVKEQVYLPERAQLCAQALVLQENGYTCDEGVIYFVDARRRLPVTFDDALRRRVLAAAESLRELSVTRVLPPPLHESPRCVGCSLVGICLPDEVGHLQRAFAAPRPVRRLYPARDDRLPIHVQQQGGRVGRRKGELHVTLPGERKPVLRAGLRGVSQLAIYGNVQLSTQVLRTLCQREIPVTLSTYGGWFYGMISGLPHRNVLLRQRQFEVAAAPERSLPIARSLVEQKIRNQRTLLRRNARGEVAGDLTALKQHVERCREAASAQELLGIEGSAARAYFSRFTLMLRRPETLPFEMNGRNRRPPRDPVNALLSFCYALLVKDVTIILAAIGLDPYLGFYHQPRYGRPSLALDLMEPFRPLIADSTVINLINNGVIDDRSFIRAARAIALTQSARARVIKTYERRMNEKIKHPIFGYRVSYRRILEVQARLTGRYIVGELECFPELVTR